MDLRELWLLLLGLAVLLARGGLFFYLCGSTRSKNAAGAILRATADFCLAVLAFWAVGNAILSNDLAGVLGRRGTFGITAFFDCTIVLIATGAALGGTLERAHFLPTLFISALVAGLLVPLAGRWEWYGWLYSLGFVDVGGAACLHIVGGIGAAVGAVVIGPRGGKYNQDGSTNLIPGHSFPMVAAGAMAMIFGILPQLAGCAILGHVDPAAAIASGLLAAAAAGISAMALGRYRYGITDVHLAIIGMLGGVVAASAGAGILPSWAAVLIGAVAGVLVPLATVRIDLRRKIDDPSSAIAIHAVGGAWGLLATGILISGGIGFRLHQLLIQLIGLAAIAAFSLIVLAAAWLVMRSAIPLRLGEADELDGGDLAELDVNAYPDFQQTTIKSYHLRET